MVQHWGMGVAEEPEKRSTIRKALRDPHWWFRDVVMALIIGGLLVAGTVTGQKLVDDRRSDREEQSALSANRHDLQLENLRFVRDRAFGQPEGSRRFAEFDLAGQNMVGLPLAGSDFAVANLAGANMSESDLSRANFARADLRGTDFARATLRGAYFGPERIPDATSTSGADLTGTDLTGADLTDADLGHANLDRAQLDRAVLTNVYYDADTRWPQGFTPPASRPRR
jgi:uncharacterized protein YjbI with pentapeptide repeats